MSSVIFGGASREHASSVALVELIAIPLLCVAGYQLFVSGAWRQHRTAVMLLAAVVALPIFQLVPLPPELWTSLPGREDLILALRLTEQRPSWGPMSLTPDATMAALLALIPPVAMVLAMLLTPSARRLSLAGLYVGAAVCSILIGAAQLSVGDDSLHPYRNASPGSVEGLFANRNHLAAFVLMTLPVAAGLAVNSVLNRPNSENTRRWMFALYAALAVIAIGLIRSRAGVVLVGPALIASLLFVWQSSRKGASGWPVLGLAAISAAAVAAVAAFGLAPILARFEALNAAPEGRFEAWPIVLEAGAHFQPIGSGLGSFDPVFRSAETLTGLGPAFFNQAHNDYLEIWLETGLLGVALMAWGLAWVIGAWRETWHPSVRRLDKRLAQAAGFSVLVVLLHSVVDYPLRTETIAVFFAFCLGALTAPLDLENRAARS